VASGDFSTAMGINTLSNGQGSTAMGSSTVASGLDSTAMGFDSEATGDGSTAIGRETTASGGGSIAMGNKSISSAEGAFAIGNQYDYTGVTTPTYLNEASGARSFVIGNNNSSTNFKAFSIGTDNLSSGRGAFAVGENNIASGDFSHAIGLFSETIAYSSFALGNNALADGYNTTAIGTANTVDVNADPVNWSLNNRAFVIGNGYYDINNQTLNRSDALTVLFDGTTTIAGDLSINSDARLKANIISLGSTLAKLLQIDGKSYTMKKDENKKQKIGVLAQDIEKVFPELVSESNGIKSVNYQGLIPVLINALKEQDAKMNEQQTEIDTYRDEVSELKEIVQALISRE
jgi:hypothetical protein